MSSDTTTTTTERSQPRAMLALIALATDLPVPEAIYLYDNGILSMNLRSLAEGYAWLRFLGHTPASYANNNGYRHLKYGTIEWHGWHVHIQASDPAVPDTGLDQATTTALADLAGDPR